MHGIVPYVCLGVPARVTKINAPTRATVDIGGVSRIISTDLLIDDTLAVDDWVLVHVGFALSKIDGEEAAMTLDQIKKLGANTYEDELESFSSSDIRP